ncbi:MAG: YidC/Oxa1 family membrane protein insertase [Candidatus Curtissbacteria bacterium]|nr:YidC/Oxa1 family membrane protein insertase [Candidatus Curtissbacteria bacterium]
MNPFELFLTNPILNILIAIYKVLEGAGIPGALGFAIILLSIIIRMIMWPLTTAQLRSTQKMAALKPHLSRIKEQHGHDKARHQQEVSKLYKEHGVNPLAGCLPLLLQIPVFLALYNVLQHVVQFSSADFLTNINSKLYFPSLHLDKIPETSFLGLNLGIRPNEWQQVGVLILLVPVVTGLLQLVQSLMMAPPKVQTSGKKESKKEQKQGFEDSMAQMQTQMVFIMPLLIAFFSYGFPFGLSLYWNTFTIIGAIQQYVITGAGQLNKYLPKGLQKGV